MKEDWKIYRVLYAYIYLPIDNYRRKKKIEKRRNKHWKEFGERISVNQKDTSQGVQGKKDEK